MWVLTAVAVVVVGFALGINAMLVVTVAGIVAGLIGHLSPVQILDAFGTGFAGSRSVTVFIVTLPVIGLLERYGLQEQARRLISKLAGLTAGRLLGIYLLVRQGTAALGLTAIAGPAQTVRPLVYPMAEAAAVRKHGELPENVRERLKGYTASSDTVGLFFGEDIFVAVGSILLITAYVDTNFHLTLEAIDVALWAIPTAICALLLHGIRMLMVDRCIDRSVREAAEPGGPADPAEPAASATPR